MKELKHLRKRNEKQFLNDDGSISLYLYNNDIHYLKNGEYQEIDNTLVEEGNNIINKENNFHTRFTKDTKTNLLVDITKDNYYLKIYLMKSKNNVMNMKRNKNNIKLENILEDIDIDYHVISTQLKEAIILKNKNNIPTSLSFKVDTNLDLEVEEKGSVLAKDKDKTIFVIAAPFMKDNKGTYNYKIKYDLSLKDDTYILNLNLDQEWLNEAEFPVVIDPTIVNTENNSIVADAYIYSWDNEHYTYDNTMLKVGLDPEQSSNIYASLIKFNLPNIGTGYEIIDARAYLISHASDTSSNDNNNYIYVYEMEKDWNENDVNFMELISSHNNHIEDFFLPTRSKLDGDTIHLQTSSFNITSLMKKWYAGKPNYGIILTTDDLPVNCKEYTFYSKDNTVTETSNPAPYLVITYRNQNGLEDYMTYQTQEYTDGTSYINNLTGNLTATFNLNETIGGKYPIGLSLVYNTNDMVLNNNYDYQSGYKLNLHETIKEVTIDLNNYLEYTDADGTIHYFRNELDEEGEKIDNKYIDEDGLGLNATKETNKIIIEDMNSNKYEFSLNNNIYYLNKLTNTNNDSVTITYDTNNRINKVTDANNSSINITYNTNNMIITSDSTTTTVNYTNNKVTSIISKNGTTNFTYNNYGLISKITDVNGLSKVFNYYDVSPYKIKKVIEYGLNDEEGASLEFEYGFLVTRVKDNKDRYNTYIFNEQGNTIGFTNLDEEANLNNAYGKGITYEKEKNNETNRAVNNVNEDIQALKYTKNLINDSSFEYGSVYEEPYLTTEYSNSGSHSYKLENTYIISKEVEGNENYTFSLFIKNNSKTFIDITTPGVSGPDWLVAESIPINEEFTRYDYSFFLPSGKSEVNIALNIDSGVAYLDDLQLEKGKTVSYHNIMDHSDFSGDIWEYGENTEIFIDKSGPTNILTIYLNEHFNSELKRTLPISGKKGDSFNLSFLYRNKGIIPSIENNEIKNKIISFNYNNEVEAANDYDQLIYNNNEWQFYSKVYTAEEDYSSILFDLIIGKSANTFDIANVTLSKSVDFNKNEYNKDKGTLKSYRNQNGEITNFTYDENNQLTSMFNPLGNNFKFEYDNVVTDRILKGVSPSGISNEILYDEFGNPKKTIINNVNPAQDIIDGKTYYIRLKGSQEYWDSNFITNEILLKEDNCSHDTYTLLKEGEYFRIKSGNEYVTLINDSIGLTKLMTDDSLFRFFLQNNNSYIIIPKTKDNTLLEHNLANVNGKISLKTSDTKEYEEQFYFEDIDTQMFIESKAEYTEDGKFVTKTIDSLGKVTSYDINTTNGLTNSITDANNITTYYTYNTKDQITKVKKENKEVNYDYNSNNLLSKITSNNKEYNFTYDNFLNAKQIKIGDNITLITNNYENNNGNLLSSVYGNGDTITYTYDELDRINTLSNSNVDYNYIYNNLGNISRIEGRGRIFDEDDGINIYENHSYYYDFGERLKRYIYENKFNKLTIAYNYDKNNNITQKNYIFKKDELNEQTEETTFEYNTDDAITKVTFDNNNLNYAYDYLGRLTSKDINGNQKIEYTYITNGNKTSTVLKSMKINNDLYEYYYDHLYNITDIYLNNKLSNHYEYDNFNELIKEDNYSLNKTIRYTYDNAGNILKKQEYELDTYNLLHTDTYEYNNVNWEDQLTKYNNESITYDAIGNPVSIGNKTLTWVNGRQLASYTDESLNISYTYNKDGIRTEKVINNTKTNYFTENNKIIFEQAGNNMVYYIRDEEGSLIGFKYNNTLYYYIKNMQEDIIGITDSNDNLVCSYEYDPWGKLISIKDNNNYIITNTSHIGYINPFRYRSYYYDNETKLYYLNSRYYNPEWGRFINADKFIKAEENKYNLYMYCKDNPIKYVDYSGSIPGILSVLAGAAAVILYPLAVSAAQGIANIVGDIVEDIITHKPYESKSNKNDKDNKKDYYVYALKDPNNNFNVEYVGRTKNLNSARSRHQSNPYRSHLVLKTLTGPLTYEQSRVREQYYIKYYKTLNKYNKMNNQINGLSPNKYDKYKTIIDELGEDLTYVGGSLW